MTWCRRPLNHFHSAQEANRWNTRYASLEAGSTNTDGYREVRVDKQRYGMHRIIYKMMTGEDPLIDVDHQNHIRSDNRWENLRQATKGEQAYNSSLRRDNTSGSKGIFIRKSKTGKLSYVAFITVSRKRKVLGTFQTKEEAHDAYCDAGRKLHGNFFSPAKRPDDAV